MPDRYEIRKRGGKMDRWALHRIDDDEEFGFDKLVGLFDRKPELLHALDRIKLHEDRNFAEWFYVRRQFFNNGIINQEIMARHFFKMWRAIGGHLTVDAKREMLSDVAAAFAYVQGMYEQNIENLELAHAQELAGESW